MNEGRTISFTFGGLAFEYDEQKNQINIKKHGISFKSAARIFFDYDRIGLCDDEHSEGEIRYDTIGDTSSGNLVLVGEVGQSIGKINEILFVVYTERIKIENNGKRTEVTRLISARLATNFERGLYYGKYDPPACRNQKGTGFYSGRIGGTGERAENADYI